MIRDMHRAYFCPTAASCDNRAALAICNTDDRMNGNERPKAIQLIDSHTVDNEAEKAQLLANHLDDPKTTATETVSHNYVNSLLMLWCPPQDCDPYLLLHAHDSEVFENVLVDTRVSVEMLINLSNCWETTFSICHVCYNLIDEAWEMLFDWKTLIVWDTLIVWKIMVCKGEILHPSVILLGKAFWLVSYLINAFSSKNSGLTMVPLV